MILKIIIIKRKYLMVLILMILVGIFSYKLIGNKSLDVYKESLNKVIVVDAGHGGIDGGAVSKNEARESDMNLRIALKVRELLEQNGAIVLLTRDQDVGLYSDTGTIRKKKNEDLRERKKMVDESQSDLFISIHMNSFPQQPTCSGAQTFYPKNCENSKKIANYIQEELIRVLDNKNKRKSKEKNDIYLLKKCSIPTVLVECGFLTNPKEERLLKDETYQEKVAWGIYIGILRYFDELDKTQTEIQ